MSDTQNFVRTVCPRCSGAFEFPADYFGEQQPCPHCKVEVRLAPRVNLESEHFDVRLAGQQSGPFSLAQIHHQWQTAALNTLTEVRSTLNGDWFPITDLRLDSTGWKSENTPRFLISEEPTAGIIGPFSTNELKRRLPSFSKTACFWCPGLSHWTDAAGISSELERDANPDAQPDEPPAYSKFRSKAGAERAKKDAAVRAAKIQSERTSEGGCIMLIFIAIAALVLVFFFKGCVLVLQI
jgi:hypothetical protein